MTKDMVREYLDSLGQEAEKELEEDTLFIASTFSTQVITGLITVSEMISTHHLDPAESLRSLYIKAIMDYRDYLIERGVDVRSLEGR